MSKNFHKVKNGINLEPKDTAPVSPDAGDLYFSSNDGLQVYQNGGWVAPGAGSGSGELNLIDNPNDANQNWFVSAGTGDISFSTTSLASEIPLEGIIRTAIKITCSVSGTKYIYTRFKIPDVLLTAKEKIEWYQKILSGFNANEWKVELWWNDNSSYSGTFTEFPLKNDVSGISYIPNLTTQYFNQWTGISSAQYLELRISRPTGAGLCEWTFTNTIAGPGIYFVDAADPSPQMAGTIVPYSGPTTGFDSIGSDGTTLLIKNGWALCNGASISQATYDQLFTNIGTTWNTGARQDGTGGNYSAPSGGFFRIPDLRGVFLRGVGTSSRADGSGDVVRTLAQFANDTTAPNGMSASSSTTTSNTDLAHTHSATGLTVSGTNSSSAVTGTANTGVNLAHGHGITDPGHDHTTNFGAVGVTLGGTNIIDNAGASIYTRLAGASLNTTGISINNSESLDHSHTLTGTAAAQLWSGSVAGSTSGASATMNHAHSASTSTSLSGDSETAPRHTAVNYLIKLFDSASVNIFNSRTNSPFKAGFIIPGGQSTAPQGWLLCGGQAVSRTTYAELFTAIGTTFGSGDGSTTFNVPDLRGRTVAGRDDMEGVAANRLTAGVSGITGTTLGASGGSQAMQQHNHTATGLTVSGTNLPSAITSLSLGTETANHTHSDAGHSHSLTNGSNQWRLAGTGAGMNAPGFNNSSISLISVDTGFASLGTQTANHSHNLISGTVAAQLWNGSVAGNTANFGTGTSGNVQPTLILNYFIKAFNDTIDVTGFNEASPTSTGFMTNSAQTIGGLKTFQDGIVTSSISNGPPTVFTSSGTIVVGLNIGNSVSSIILTLPPAIGQEGKQFIIKNINTGQVTITPDGSETIDGELTVLLNQYSFTTLIAYAGQWYAI